jgi:type I restriction enzyme S subunit
MKLETFFEKFDDLADAPNAVGKMRELILQLAAHGKLVEQSSDDEPASVLVAQIAKHIEGLRSRKEFRGSPVELLARDELPEIPSSWEWVRLGNVVDYGSSDKAESADIPEDAWLLDLEDIEKDTSRLLQRKAFRESPSKSTKTAFAVGDVLYGKLRPYLNKVIVADAPGYCTTEIIPIRTFRFIDPAYLCHTLKRPEFIAYANSKSYGMNLPRLGTEDARSAPFPLPPLAEQKRIVAKVDELMAWCDRLEAQQQEREQQDRALARAALARFADAPTPANLEVLFHPSFSIPPSDLRKSILTLAVQGKLVPQDPNDEPAQPAVAQIERERERLIAAKQFRRSQLPGPIDEGPFDIPDTWVWTHLGNSMLNVTDGFHSTPKTVESGVRYVTAKHVKPGLIDFDSCLYVSEDDFKEIASKTRPRKGDVLVVNIGAGSGLASIIETDFEFAFKNVAILNRPEEVDAKFLFNYLVFKRDDIFEEQTKGGAQPFLSLGLIRQIPFPLPPLAEQRRIVAKVDELMALVDALETQLATARTTAETLLTAAVGELTNGKGKP